MQNTSLGLLRMGSGPLESAAPRAVEHGLCGVWAGACGHTHMRVEAVRHELKLAIWRDEGDGAVVLEA